MSAPVKNGKFKGRPPAMRRPRVPTRPGYSGLEMTNAELGDLVEAALVRKFEWTPLVGASAGRVRQGPFDLIDENGCYTEVKACSVYASEYKVKPDMATMMRKMEAAAKLGKDGIAAPTSTVLAVVERTRKGKLVAHVYRRPGLGCFRLGMSGVGWEYVGKARVL